MNKTIYALFIIELLWVGWIDFKTKKISNIWNAIHLLLAGFLYVFQSSTYPYSWEVFIFPIGTLIVGFLLFLANVMGAGDSKFLASLFFIIPLHAQSLFLQKLILSTVITGGILLSLRVLKNWTVLRTYLLTRHWKGLKDMVGSRFSYAPVIGVAWILFGVALWGQ